MGNQSENESFLLNGRMFTAQELKEVKDIVRMFPRLSQRELALTICEGLSWLAPNGKYKIDACRQLLLKLEAEAEIELPKKRMDQSLRKKQTVIIGSQTEEDSEMSGPLSLFEPIQLEAVRSKESIHLWNEYVERYHYLGYKRPFGAHQRYFIRSTTSKKLVGCILFSAAAWALAERDVWIGWEKEDRSQRLHLIVNNTRFLIFPWVKVKNLASKVLSLAAKQVRIDFQERYGYEPVLLETFVDVERYQGTIYQAANWVKLGLTAGRGRMDRYRQKLSSPKQIYMYPLHSDFKAMLCGEREERHE